MFAAKDLWFTPRVMFDTKGTGTLTGALTNPTISHTITGNLLVVAAATVSGDPSACKVGTTTMTAMRTPPMATFSSGFLNMWFLLNPPRGAQTITITCSNSFTACGSLSYFNAETFQSDVSDNFSNFTSSPANTTIGAPPGSITVCAYADSGSTTFSAFSGTQRYNDPFSSGVNYPFFMGDQAELTTAHITTGAGSDLAGVFATFTAV